MINAGELGMPYALFVIYGLLLYRTFSESVIAVLRDDRYRKELEAGALEYAHTYLAEADVFYELGRWRRLPCIRVNG